MASSTTNDLEKINAMIIDASLLSKVENDPEFKNLVTLSKSADWKEQAFKNIMLTPLYESIGKPFSEFVKKSEKPYETWGWENLEEQVNTGRKQVAAIARRIIAKENGISLPVAMTTETGIAKAGMNNKPPISAAPETTTIDTLELTPARVDKAIAAMKASPEYADYMKRVKVRFDGSFDWAPANWSGEKFETEFLLELRKHSGKTLERVKGERPENRSGTPEYRQSLEEGYALFYKYTRSTLTQELAVGSAKLQAPAASDAAKVTPPKETSATVKPHAPKPAAPEPKKSTAPASKPSAENAPASQDVTARALETKIAPGLKERIQVDERYIKFMKGVRERQDNGWGISGKWSDTVEHRIFNDDHPLGTNPYEEGITLRELISRSKQSYQSDGVFATVIEDTKAGRKLVAELAQELIEKDIKEGKVQPLPSPAPVPEPHKKSSLTVSPNANPNPATPQTPALMMGRELYNKYVDQALEPVLQSKTGLDDAQKATLRASLRGNLETRVSAALVDKPVKDAPAVLQSLPKGATDLDREADAVIDGVKQNIAVDLKARETLGKLTKGNGKAADSWITQYAAGRTLSAAERAHIVNAVVVAQSKQEPIKQQGDALLASTNPVEQIAGRVLLGSVVNAKRMVGVPEGEPAKADTKTESAQITLGSLSVFLKNPFEIYHKGAGADQPGGDPVVKEYQRTISAWQTKQPKGGEAIADDGVHGRNTDNAVRAFQKTYGIFMDGKVGIQTNAAVQIEQAMQLIEGLRAKGQLSSEDLERLKKEMNEVSEAYEALSENAKRLRGTSEQWTHPLLDELETLKAKYGEVVKAIGPAAKAEAVPAPAATPAPANSHEPERPPMKG